MSDPAPVATRYGAVYRFVRKRARSHEDAEDITQDVFLAAIVALSEARLREREPSLAWLYTVAKRRLSDRIRSDRARAALSVEPVAAIESRYDVSVVSSLVACLHELERGQRQVIVMKLFEGLPFREIAEKLGISEEACRARFSRGLAVLRDGLREKGLGQ